VFSHVPYPSFPFFLFPHPFLPIPLFPSPQSGPSNPANGFRGALLALSGGRWTTFSATGHVPSALTRNAFAVVKCRLLKQIKILANVVVFECTVR